MGGKALGRNEGVTKRMKKALIAVLALTVCFTNIVYAENNGGKVIEPAALQERIDANPYINLFDLRDEDAFAAGHIPYAASVPLNELGSRMREALDSGFSYMHVEIIVYGDTEEDGVKAAGILNELGFTNVYRLESLEKWTGKLVSLEDEMRLLGDLDTVDIYGNAVDGSLLRGHALTMVNVWATYCSPCINEMSDLGRLAADMKDSGVQIIGLLSDTLDASFSPVEEKVNLARQIVRQTQADYPHLLPSADLYWKVIGQINAVPTTFFVDETGMLVGSAYVGARDYDAWRAIITEMTQER